MDQQQQKTVTAAVLVIGNEILSGRTQDSNIHFIANQCEQSGVLLSEARIIPDIEAEIIDAVRSMSARYDYVFTSGGLGPTHDDITAAALARAFGVELIVHPEAMQRLEAHYGSEQFTPARQLMARIPKGATLIDNPVSVAPGFTIENVHALPGVPKILQPMVIDVVSRMAHGLQRLSEAVRTMVPESMLAEGLAIIQGRFPGTEIGSYPYMKPGNTGVAIVIRGYDPQIIHIVRDNIIDLVKKLERTSA